MDIEEWKSQMKRGTLDLCILILLNQKAYYGYELIQKISQYPIISAKESTVYPLLRRLLKEGFLTSTWQDTREGLPSRKYYSITEDGKNYLDRMSLEWNNLLNAISDLKGEE